MRMLSVSRRSVLMSAAMAASTSLTSRVARAGAQGSSAGSESTSGALPERAIGFMLAHEQFTVPELVELGVAAEQAGFDLLAASDHLQPWQSNERHAGFAWVTLAAIGVRTKRVWMGTTVTCPTFRYTPPVVAEAFASLASLCPGRIFLGVGSGEALNEQAGTGQWPRWPERSARLVEATGVIRDLWKGQPVHHAGRYYTVDAQLWDVPPSPIPILMAANVGPKAMRRSGRYGDGLITDPGTWKQHKAEFEAGAREAGKDPARMPVLVELFVTVGQDADARAAADLWRFLPKAFKSYFDVRDPAAIEQQARAEVPIDQVVGEWVVSTDPEVHAQRLIAVFQSGATIVNVHSGQPDQRRVIEFYGSEVLPRVRRALRSV